MWNKPTQQQLMKMPKMYSTESMPLKEKVIHEHFFLGGCDWYAAEYDAETHNFFGFAILNGDLDNAEWGYFNLHELADLKASFVEVDRDLHWTPTKARDIKNIAEAQGWLTEKAPA